MTPLTEFHLLISRSRKMLDAIFLLLISAAMLAVSAITLFCAIFTTLFTVVRGIADRQAARIKAPKEVGA